MHNMSSESSFLCSEVGQLVLVPAVLSIREATTSFMSHRESHTSATRHAGAARRRGATAPRSWTSPRRQGIRRCLSSRPPCGPPCCGVPLPAPTHAPARAGSQCGPFQRAHGSPALIRSLRVSHGQAAMSSRCLVPYGLFSLMPADPVNAFRHRFHSFDVHAMQLCKPVCYRWYRRNVL